MAVAVDGGGGRGGGGGGPRVREVGFPPRREPRVRQAAGARPSPGGGQAAASRPAGGSRTRAQGGRPVAAAGKVPQLDSVRARRRSGERRCREPANVWSTE